MYSSTVKASYHHECKDVAYIREIFLKTVSGETQKSSQSSGVNAGVVLRDHNQVELDDSRLQLVPEVGIALMTRLGHCMSRSSQRTQQLIGAGKGERHKLISGELEQNGGMRWQRLQLTQQTQPVKHIALVVVVLGQKEEENAAAKCCGRSHGVRLDCLGVEDL